MWLILPSFLVAVAMVVFDYLWYPHAVRREEEKKRTQLEDSFQREIAGLRRDFDARVAALQAQLNAERSKAAVRGELNLLIERGKEILDQCQGLAESDFEERVRKWQDRVTSCVASRFPGLAGHPQHEGLLSVEPGKPRLAAFVDGWMNRLDDLIKNL
jgi:hypothetical protein